MARAGEPQSMQQQTVTTNKTVTPALGGVSTATVCTTVVTPWSIAVSIIEFHFKINLTSDFPGTWTWIRR